MWTMAFCASSSTQSQSGMPSTFGEGVTGVPTGLDHPISNSADVHARTARGDDHSIGKGRPAGKVDRNDLFRFRILKSFNDDLRQRFRCGRAPGRG